MEQVFQLDDERNFDLILPSPCDQCYQKKKRCNRTVPCTNCTKKGLDCTNVRQRKRRYKVNYKGIDPNIKIEQSHQQFQLATGTGTNRGGVGRVESDTGLFSKFKVRPSIYQRLSTFLKTTKDNFLVEYLNYMLNFPISNLYSIKIKLYLDCIQEIDSKRSVKLSITNAHSTITNQTNSNSYDPLADIPWSILCQCYQNYFKYSNIDFPLFTRSHFLAKPRSTFLKVSLFALGSIYLQQADNPDFSLTLKLRRYALDLSKLNVNRKPSLDGLQAYTLLVRLNLCLSDRFNFSYLIAMSSKFASALGLFTNYNRLGSNKLSLNEMLERNMAYSVTSQLRLTETIFFDLAEAPPHIANPLPLTKLYLNSLNQVTLSSKVSGLDLLSDYLEICLCEYSNSELDLKSGAVELRKQCRSRLISLETLKYRTSSLTAKLQQLFKLYAAKMQKSTTLFTIPVKDTDTLLSIYRVSLLSLINKFLTSLRTISSLFVLLLTTTPSNSTSNGSGGIGKGKDGKAKLAAKSRSTSVDLTKDDVDHNQYYFINSAILQTNLKFGTSLVNLTRMYSFETALAMFKSYLQSLETTNKKNYKGHQQRHSYSEVDGGMDMKEREEEFETELNLDKARVITCTELLNTIKTRFPNKYTVTFPNFDLILTNN